MKRTKHAVDVVLTAGVMVFVVAAYGNTTWHSNPAKNTGDNNSYGNAALTSDMSYWLDPNGTPGSGAPTASDDLIFDNNSTTGSQKTRLRFFNANPFTGNSLQIGTREQGETVVHDGAVFKCEGTGLKLVNGHWWFNRGTSSIAVDSAIEVLENDPSHPFVMHVGQEQYTNDNILLRKELKGAADAQLLMGPAKGQFSNLNNLLCASNTTFRLYDISGYAGTITVTSAYENVNTTDEAHGFGTYLNLYTGTTTSQMKLRISRGGGLGVGYNAFAGDTVTVKELSLACGSRLWFNQAVQSLNGKLWCVRATDALTVEKGADKVEIYWKPIVRGNEHYRIPILVGPPGSTFTEDDFRITFCADQYNRDLRLVAEDDPVTGERTLYADMSGFVYQTSSYGSSVEGNRDGMDGAPSSLTNSAAWYDGLAPHETNSAALYRTALYLRTLYAPNDPYAFPCSGFFVNNGTLIIQTYTFEVPELWCDRGTIAVGQRSTGPSVVELIAPKMHFFTEGYTVTLRAYQSRTFIVKGEIDGPGNIHLLGWSGTGAPKANYMLDGPNTNYTGSITVETNETRPAYYNFDSLFPTLIVNDGRNLGGAKATFDPRALTLTSLSRLSVTNGSTVTLADGLNRGVYIKHTGRFHVTGNGVIDMKWPILLSGKMWKEGTGTLVLGGGTRHEAKDGGVLTDIPRAGSNLFEIVAGTVKVANADALAGVETAIDSGAALQLALDPSNADLMEYGIRNTTVDTPFTLASSFGGKLPLTMDTEGFAPAGSKPMTNALVTVKSTAADAVEGMLSGVRPLRTLGYSSKVVPRPNGDGTTTFLLVSRFTGTTIIFR